jgi:hypothetical protein
MTSDLWHRCGTLFAFFKRVETQFDAARCMRKRYQKKIGRMRKKQLARRDLSRLYWMRLPIR